MSAPRPGSLRLAWVVPGIFLLGLAILGALLPLMPSTVFLIGAAWCFGRSSPRLEAWLLNHPRFGPLLRAWMRERAVPRSAKRAAAIGMCGGLLLWWTTARPGWPLVLIVALLMGAVLAWIWSRPTPRDPGKGP